MHRKRFLQQSLLAMGGTLVVPSLILQSCKVEPRVWSSLTDKDIGLLNEIAETILPKTANLPGSIDLNLGDYIIDTVNACFMEEDKDVFLTGLTTFEERCIAENGKPFERLSVAEKKNLLMDIQDEAISFAETQIDVPEPKTHYFSLMKNLVVSGYFTSETVMVEAFDYSPIPGRYSGCVPWTESSKPYKG
ncbi:gluconate 2-dehydrogenase subunit 3 family protein [Croceivirga thetidis]|uniref:Gluconate 2-dehydrogenase subunit 3 family protein n=1 Tax=Croceivirga thetidis TaxID=2721623 RepID=A0ABX1GL13_9FLAO|nr:gluconate 2-dehydrogenase subunit 3 family protein [Croceivirga thetidis]NKI30587.1 gluconate 2-dehydrogenase subunit 3 family protein [Croceivirga thetidis]